MVTLFLEAVKTWTRDMLLIKTNHHWFHVQTE